MIAAPDLIGLELARWRRRRDMTQIELANAANTSAKHVSFIETGRARPSDAVLQRMMDALAVPPHEVDVLRWLRRSPPETSGSGMSEADAMAALALLLRNQKPSGSIAIDANWNIVMVNHTYLRFLRQHGLDRGASSLTPIAPRLLNVVRLLLAPGGMRQAIVNWSDVASAALARMRLTLASGCVKPENGVELLREMLKDRDVAALWANIDVDRAPALVVPARIRFDGEVIVNSTIVTLGSDEHELLQGLRVETFHRS